jgi:hypothetical protein
MCQARHCALAATGLKAAVFYGRSLAISIAISMSLTVAVTTVKQEYQFAIATPDRQLWKLQVKWRDGSTEIQSAPP